MFMHERDVLLKSLEEEYPYVYSQIKDYTAISKSDLMLYTNSGSVCIYDYLDRKIVVLLEPGEPYTEDVYRQEFARRLRKAMMLSGMTQYDLAMATGLSQSVISKYVRGKATPSIFSMEKIVEALNCTFDDFHIVI